MIMNRLTRPCQRDDDAWPAWFGLVRRGQWTWTRKLIDMYEYAKRVEGVSLVSCTSHEA